jgi:DNA replication and repair protein RecF
VVTALRLETVSVRNLRNLPHVDLEPSSRFNVVFGDNGQGKTSLLEAIYLLCTTRSFRTAKLGEVVAHGSKIASVRASVREADDKREQAIGLEGSIRHVVLEGKRPPSLASYATRSPVVVFHPGELVLSSGPASTRRMLLDRVALFVDKASMDDLARYGAAQRARQKTLEVRGVDAPELEPFERLMAEHGARLTRLRERASERIAAEVRRAFPEITAEDRPVEARYEPGGMADPRAMEEALARSRERDRHRGSAGVGPHRDDLVITLGGHAARTDASQGEHRAITMALKIAELSCIAEARGVHPILLLDDVSSELDLARTKLLFRFLRDTPGQIFLTTTRRALIETTGFEPEDRRDFAVRGGTLERFRDDF